MSSQSPLPTASPSSPHDHINMQPMNSIDEPAPTLVNRASRAYSAWSAHVPIPPAARTHPNSPEPAHGVGAPDAGIVARIEEGIHEYTEKVEHELSEMGRPLTRNRRKAMWDRFRGVGRRKVTWGESVRNTFRSSSA